MSNEYENDIILYEGGKPRTIPRVSIIQTDLEDGGVCEWMPKENAQLGTAKIEYNGEHTAEDFGYYGLSEVEVDVKEQIGDYTILIDEDGFPHIEIDDFDLTIDENGFPELENFDLDGLIENIDFDANFDISIDDMNLNLDTLDTYFELNLDTLEIAETELPDEIRVMHVPDKTSYKDGEAIDLEGIMVQAYRNGEVWNDESGRYIDGYVPVHELIATPKEATINPSKGHILILEDGSKFVWYDTNTSICLRYFSNGTLQKTRYILFYPDDGVRYFFANPDYSDKLIIIVGTIKVGQPDSVQTRYRFKDVYPNGDIEYFHWTDDKKWWFTAGSYYWAGYGGRWNHAGPQFGNQGGEYSVWLDLNSENPIVDKSTLPTINTWDIAEEAEKSIWNSESIGTGDVFISWPRPKDNKLLTATFDISVEESEGA